MTDWYERHKQDVIAKKTGIDPRPKRYIEARLNKTSAKKAAELAGYRGRVARAPFKLIETPELKRQMQEAMIAKGLTLGSIADTVANSMKANVIAMLEDGPAESDVPDHKTRLKGAEQAGKLWGLTEAVRPGDGGSTITLTLAGPLAERIAARMAEGKVIEGE